jgi:hypothetical protein
MVAQKTWSNSPVKTQPYQGTTPGRRPYVAPTLKKQSNLKSVTLFTSFGPDRGGDGSTGTDQGYLPNQP